MARRLGAPASKVRMRDSRSRNVAPCVPSAAGRALRRGMLPVVLLMLAHGAGAQGQVSDGTAIRRDTARRASFGDFEGEFAYHGTSHIVLVARDSILFAVLDDARYPLRPLGDDRFLNAGG